MNPTPRPMPHSCYLVAWVDSTSGRLNRIVVASEFPCETTTINVVQLKVHETFGSSYHTASKRMSVALRDVPALAWTHRFMDRLDLRERIG